MAHIKLKDVINRVQTKVDKDNTSLIYYVGGEHIESENVCITKRGLIEGSTIGPMFYYGFKAGDFLLVSRNPHLKKAGVVGFDGICSEKTFVLATANSEVLLPEYLPFILQNDTFWEYAYQHRHGSTNTFINWSTLANYEFELPNIEIQRKLAEILWAINDTMESYKRLILATDELVKSQFLGEFGDPVANPMHWKTTPLLEMGKCKNGMNFSTKDSGFDISCLGVADFQSRLTIHEDTPLSGISLNEMPGEDYLLKNGDIVFVRSNGNKELVGRSVLVKFTDRIATFSGFCIRFRKEANCLNEIYLLHLLRMDSVRKKLRGRGANVQNLSQQTLANIDVPLPPLPLQEQFAAFVRQSDKSKFELEQALSELTATYKRIISEQLG